jgi:hypothetical protein
MQAGKQENNTIIQVAKDNQLCGTHLRKRYVGSNQVKGPETNQKANLKYCDKRWRLGGFIQQTI